MELIGNIAAIKSIIDFAFSPPAKKVLEWIENKRQGIKVFIEKDRKRRESKRIERAWRRKDSEERERILGGFMNLVLTEKNKEMFGKLD